MKKSSSINNSSIFNWLPDIFDLNDKPIKSFKSQILSVKKQLKKELTISEINPSSEYWNSRPSRIFWLDPEKDEELFELERSRLLELLKYNYYDKKILLEFFKDLGDDEVIDKVSNIPSLDKNIYFPSKIKSKNKLLPLVSFSSFSIQTKRNSEEYFIKPIKALKKKLNINITESYIPEISLYDKLDGKSYDLAFVTFILLDNHKHLFKSLPKLCCTGVVDENGYIKRIKYAKDKLEAAKQFNFDYILFPEANKDEIEASDKVIFFNNIVDVDNWIKEIAKSKTKNRIKHWLSIGGETPTKEEFFSFFSVTRNKNLSYWQRFLKFVPIDDAINRISKILKEYNHFASNSICIEEKNKPIEDSIFRIIQTLKLKLPKFKFYALIPELINILKDYNRVTDYLSFHIYDAIECQSPDFAIATKIIRDSHSINNISENQYLRERYPHLLCFYFNHPTELIYILTSTNNLTDKESKLLDKICDLLIKDESENTIINTALQTLNSLWNLHFEAKSESIPHAQQLAFLTKSIENLKNKKNLNNTAIRAINKYIEKIDSLIKDKGKAGILIESYGNKIGKTTVFLPKIENQKNGFDVYLNLCELVNKETRNTLLNLGLNYDIYTFLKNDSTNYIQRLNFPIKSDDHLFYKKGISYNNYKNNYFNQLCNSLNLGKMGDLITECIAFFYGKYVVRCNNPRDLRLLSQNNKFDLPFTIGLMCQNHPEKRENYIDWYFNIIKEIFNRKKTALRQLMWLYLLYYTYNFYNDEHQNCFEKYKKIIIPELSEYLLSFTGKLEENSEFKREFEFIGALFGIHNKKLGYNNFGNDAYHAIEAVSNTQKTITRTEQLLFPIFLFLSNLEERQSTDKYNKFGSQLNNSRFVLEFIRAFGISSSDLNELFKPIHGFSDIERHIFETMAIIRLDIEEPDHYLLKKYILNNISDFANLNFALNILGFK